jgi:hypothetical protein
MSLKRLTKAQLATMVQLQHEANSVMSDNWLLSNNSTIWYFRAGAQELSELIGHLGIKWWKNEHPTEELMVASWEQAVMELIDYIHFSISDVTRTYAEKGQFDAHEVADVLAVQADVAETKICQTRIEIIGEVETAIATILNCKTASWVHANHIADAMQLVGTDLFNMYMSKNLLNKFRTSNGQREGTYMKIWDGVEDNVYLVKYLNEALKEDNLDIDTILGRLTATYKDLTDLNLTSRG